MREQVIRCDECRCQNRLPEGWLVEARCRRCENALTFYTRLAGAMRSRLLIRTIQGVGAIALLVVLFGSDVAAWWESKPFRLNEARAASVEIDRTVLPANSLANDSTVQ